jgi:large repetitive protein
MSTLRSTSRAFAFLRRFVAVTTPQRARRLMAGGLVMFFVLASGAGPSARRGAGSHLLPPLATGGLPSSPAPSGRLQPHTGSPGAVTRAGHLPSSRATFFQVPQVEQSAVALSSSLNPSLSTRPPILTAIVSAPPGVTPTGTVEFFDGLASLGVAPVRFADGLFAAAIAGSALAVDAGPHLITARYSGDAAVPGNVSNVVAQVVRLGTYRVSNIGVEGSRVSVAALNNAGQVAGNVADVVGSGAQGFVWTEAGFLNLGTLGGSFSVPQAINDRGMVVGFSGTVGDAETRPFAWTPQGGIVDLGTFGGDNGFSSASAVNNRGMVAGYAAFGEFAQHAFVWTSADRLIDLGTFGGDYSFAYGLNNHGAVVGASYTAVNTFHAFVWTQAAGMVDLGTLGGGYSSAFAINDEGTVIGQSTIPGDAEMHAFAWTEAGGLVDLGTLGGLFTSATALNARDIVAGFSSTPADRGLGFLIPHGFVWTPSGGIVDLGTLGGSTSTATAVNDSGVVVGYSATTGDAETHAFMWTPAIGMVEIGTPRPGLAVGVNAASQVLVAADLSGFLLTSIAAENRTAPTVTWTDPADIVFGTALGAVQLNATADVNGTFEYAPQAGTILNAGNAQTLTATFTPADSDNYFSASATARINVLQATPTITWSRPAAIVYGTPLGPQQLNATANVPGTFAYAPPAGTILPIGVARPLTVVFTPSDTLNYATAAATTTVDVLSAGSPVQPPFQVLHAFTYFDGAYPASALIQASDKFFYGTTYSGGSSGGGTVFRMTGAGSVTTLHSFTFADGANPWAALLQARDGSFYGTTSSYGPNGYGTLYRIDPSGTFTTVHAFSNTDGAFPYAAVIQTNDGALYGTTVNGGSGGYGTVFRVDAGGSLTTLHSFSYGDGAYPYGGLIQASDGVVYGTTTYGGSNGVGTIFRLGADGALTTLHTFTYGDGAYPIAALIQASDGFLYGTTSGGAPTGAGTVFRIDAAGDVTTLHAFTYTDGANPRGALVQASDGFFYGTTFGGGRAGTAYRMDAAGNLTTLRAFTGPDGSSPNGSLIQGSDGFLYGTTQYGGFQGSGTAFRLRLRAPRALLSASQLVVFPVFSPYGGSAHLFATLASNNVPLVGRTVSFALAGTAVGSALTDTNGFAVFGPVSLAGINAGTYVGAIGASFTGDASYLASTGAADLTIFRQTPFVRWAFPSPIVYGTPLGAAQLSATADVPGTFTYTPPMGTVLAVGARQTLSVLFTPADLVNYFTATASVTIDVSSAVETQSTLQSLFAFSGVNGASPYAGLIQALDGLFYGATAYGGANGFGSVFRIDASGALTTLHDFTGEDGAYPYGRLVQATNGAFYGTTAFGGPGGYGSVYHMDGSGVVTMLHAFDYSDGASPYAGLLEANDGWLYGTTSEGGFTGYGTVFRIGTAGGLTTLHAFTNADGAFPYAPLVRGHDGSFYGTTLQGGPSGYGVAYRMDATGSVTSLHAFSWFDGAYPYAGLTPASDGSFYGTTSYGGPSGAGTVFRTDTAGVTTMLRGFTFEEGGYPFSSVIQRSDGYFYGTTTQGGSGGGGTLYRMDASGTTTTVHEFSFADGAAPYGALIEGADGSLYGTTQDGGPHNLGTVFRLRLRAITQLAVSMATAVYGGTTTLSATLTSAGAPLAGREVSFTLNGSPVGAAITDGNGTAAIAGVSVASLSPGTYPGAVSAIFAGDDAHSPSAGFGDLMVAKLTPLVTWPAPDAITYGTALDSTQLNATANVDGTFVYTPAAGTILPVGAAQVLSVLFTPFDSAIYASQVAYVTIDVVSVFPPAAGSLQVLHSFTGFDGSGPFAALTMASDGLFHGTTVGGGPSNVGTVYSIDPANAVSTIHAFAFAEGAFPYAGVVRASDGSVYGTTSSGGAGSYGTVYRVNATGVMTTLQAFNYLNGATPYGTLLQATDGFFYGTTYSGGPSGVGTIYRVDTAGSLTTLHGFTYSDGGFPFSGLIQAMDGSFYGTTTGGGPTGYGTVYRMDAEGRVTTLHGFGYTDGANPYAGLVQASDGSFYGTTYAGGPVGYGTVFRITAAGQFTMLHGFSYTDGAYPYSPPIQARDGFFYGTTSSGGPTGAGTIYRMDAAGQFTTLHQFAYNDGANPYARLTQSSDGSLYGATYSGGVFGAGTVFRLTLRAASQLVAAAATGSYGGTTTLSATLTSGSSPLPGREVTFAVNGAGAGTATTNDAGIATLAGVSLFGLTAGTYPGAIRANFAGDSSYASSDGFADLTISRLTPFVTWPTPRAIDYGTPLDATQLNATANVEGTFVYSPPAGTILPIDAGQTLSVEFTPLDTVNYTSASATVTIDVVERSLFFGATDFGTFNLGGLEVPLSAIGGDGHYSWTVASGMLPPGISIRTDVPSWFAPSNTAGLIGVATTPGTYSFRLRVTSGAQAFERDCTLRIASLLVSESYQLPDAFVGEPYSYMLSATGNAAPVVWTSIFVPPGMTLDSSGVLSGAPTAAGFSYVYFSASDGVDTVFRFLSLFVSAINITTPGVLPNATQFADYTATLTASGGAGGYVFRADFPPFGLVVDPSGSISGSVNAGPGKWGFTVTVTDSAGTTYTTWMSIDIIGVPPTLPQIAPFGERFDDCTVGAICERGIGVYSGGTAPYSWTAHGLPPGMWIRSGSGYTPAYFIPGDAQIAGTPSIAGTYAVEISVTDALGVSATNTYPLNVSSLAQTDFLPPGNIGEPYSAKLRVIGGTLPYTAAHFGGQLPAGLNFDPATLVVSGTPIESGFFDPLLRFTDAAGGTLVQRNFIRINAGTSTVSINMNGDLGTLTIGQFYSQQLFACCAASYEWSLIGGMLPPGLGLSTDGQLTGTATATGSYTFLVRASDAANSANYGIRQFTLAVTSLFVTTNFDLPDGFVNTPFSVALTVSGGTGPFTWALKQFNHLPPGLTLAVDGTLSGRPTATGQFFFNVMVTDAAGSVLTPLFRVSVYPEGFTPPVRHLQSEFDFGLGEIQLSLSASGGNGTYAWELVSGSLPPGVALRTDLPSWFPPGASAGLLGVATVPGTYVFTLRASSGTQSTDQVYRLRISAIVLTDLYSLPDAFVGSGYSYRLSAFSANGPVTFEATSPLPPGMTLDSSGALSGTPTASGFYNVNFRLNDGVGIAYNGMGLNVSEIEITTPAMLPNATQFSTYTTTVTARGGSGSYTFTSSSVPFGLVLDPSGTISGTVDAGPGKWSFSLTATDTNQLSYTRNMSIDVVGVPPTLPAIGVGRFDDCTVNVRCEWTFPVFAGGTAPFAWTATGLPPGMSIRTGADASSYLAPGDVQLMGAATAPGTYAVTLTVTDAAGTSASTTFDLRVSSMLQRDNFHNASAGAAFSAKLRVIGGTPPYTVAQISGRFPAGLSFDPANLVVSGTPIESGFFDAVLQFTDALGDKLQQTNYFSISGGPVQIYTGSDLGTITLGSFYFNQLFACCADSYAWSVAGGTLPPGLSLSTNGDLSGTPTTAGTFTFLVSAADAANSANFGLRQFRLTVTPLSVPGNYDLPDGFVNTPYSVALIAAGGVAPYTWALDRGNYLPPGLTLAADGTLAGTPTGGGQFFLTVTVTDAAGDAFSRQFHLTVYAEGTAPPIRDLQGPIFEVGLGEIQLSLAASGGNGTYVWEMVGGSLPPGVSLRTDGPSWFPPNASAGLLGVATSTGTYSFTLRVTSGTQSVDRGYRLRVSSIVMNDLYALPDAFVGRGYSYGLSAIGANGPIAWSANGGLPPGMTLDASGALSGAPTIAGFYFLNLRLTDSVGTAFYRVSVNVYDIEITTPGALPNATQFSTYTTTVTATGGSGAYTFTSNSLPSGLTLDPSGTISGTVTAGAGNWGFTVTATDTNHVSYSRNMSIDIVGVPPVLPAIGGGPFDDCTFAVRCERTISVFAGGTAPFTWTATGLPPGMSMRFGTNTSSYLSPGDAELIGAPTALGTYAVMVTVTDFAGASASNTFPLRVSELLVRDSFQSGTVGVPLSAMLRVIGGTQPYTIAQIGGDLPAGLTFDPATFLISGTPLESGFFNAVFQFTDALGATLRQTNYFSIDGGTSSVAIYGDGVLGTTTLGEFVSGELFACCASSYAWSVISGALPPGISLSIDGELTGTPTEAGMFTFLLRAADAADSSSYGLRQFTLAVTPLSIANDFTLPDGSVNAAYSTQLTASGGTTPYTWTLAPDAYLPTGLTLAADGALAGTPAASGQFFFAVTLTDADAHVLRRGFRMFVYPEGDTHTGADKSATIRSVELPSGV